MKQSGDTKFIITTVIRKIAETVLLLIILSLLVFALMYIAPGDPAALADAVLALLDRRDGIRPADPAARRAQREAVAAEHERLYARALAVARSRQTVGA